MSIEQWSDNILVVDLQDDPALTDDLVAVLDQTETRPDLDVVLDFASTTYLNSSNLAKLLKLRKQLSSNKRRLLLCGISTQLWGLFLYTQLDKVFEFADDVGTALASLQLAAGG